MTPMYFLSSSAFGKGLGHYIVFLIRDFSFNLTFSFTVFRTSHKKCRQLALNLFVFNKFNGVGKLQARMQVEWELLHEGLFALYGQLLVNLLPFNFCYT